MVGHLSDDHPFILAVRQLLNTNTITTENAGANPRYSTLLILLSIAIFKQSICRVVKWQ